MSRPPVSRAPKPVLLCVVSDLHAGSRYCLKKAIREHVRWCYAAGARHTLIPGDALDGFYDDHGTHLLTSTSADDQADEMLDAVPELPGNTVSFITGNHEDTYRKRGAGDVGELIEARAMARGRGDVRYVGERAGRVRVEGVEVELWHPNGGGGGNSGPLHKRIAGYGRGQEPDVLLVGHYHAFAHVVQRGVHGVMCPTYQAARSGFSRSMASLAPQAVGGLLLAVTPGEAGRGAASCSVMFRAPSSDTVAGDAPRGGHA